MKLCRKLPIINVQHPHWNTVTTSGPHHDPNHKGGTRNNIINPNCILLETCSTISSTRNKSLVQNFQPCYVGEEPRAYTNGGHQDYDHTATLKMLPFEDFLNEQSLANILSFATVASKFRITNETELDPLINAHLHDGTRIIFKQCRARLYYFDTTNEAFAEDQTTYYTFLNTVDSNKSCFHRR